MNEWIPNTRCCVPLIRSLASMFTRFTPILWAEDRARVRFSCLESIIQSGKKSINQSIKELIIQSVNKSNN